jgi:hypothetical protein
MLVVREHKLVDTESFEQIPRRVFLDTCVVNLTLEYGEQIHDGAEIPAELPERVRSDVEAACGIFDTGQRAFWQLAISPHTYREVTATNDPGQAYELERWFFEVWHYWREFLHGSSDLPSFSEAEETRLSLLSSGMLDVLPDIGDRVLLCDAVVYRCDAFCTRDWRTILTHRDRLAEVPLKIITPSEWWAEIRPWAAVWL